jgi:hypothetical protein
MQTRKDEVKEILSTSEEILKSAGKFISKKVLKGWKEDFVDVDSGEVVSIDRNEVLYDKGVEITQSLVSELLFHFQCGDFNEIEVSDQRRAAYEYNYGTWVYLVVVAISIKRKKLKFLLKGVGVPMVLEAIRDYIELNYIGGFRIISIKEFNTSSIIEDNLVKESENQSLEEISEGDDKFYQLNVIISIESSEFSNFYNAVVKTSSLEKAMILLENYIKEHIDQKDKVEEIVLRLEEAKIIKADCIIDDEFTAAYKDN